MISRIFMPAILALSLIPICATQASATQIPWQPNWNSAVTQGQRSHRLILVDFYTDWCGWCKKMDADVYPNPAVARAMTQYVPLRLNAEQNGAALARRYKVHGYPTIMVLDDSGNVVDRFAGYMKPADFAEWLGDTVHNHAAASKERPATQMSRIHETTKFIPSHQGDPIEAAPTLALAQKYLDRGDVVGAGRIAVKVAHSGGAIPAAFYGKLGDAALQDKKLDAAWGWRQMEIKSAKSPDEKASAQLQSARVELTLGSITQATARLKSLTQSDSASDTIKSQAQALLDEIDAPAAKNVR
jgi:thioredoxin-like negative regulator of GroEL